MDQRGNILFLILLAVILFAALSYAVTSSINGGSKNGTDENAKLAAANVLQQAIMLKNELNRFLLANNYTIDDIDIVSSSVSGGNAAACGSNACNLLSQSGGKTVMPRLPLNYSDPIHSAYYPGYKSAGGVNWYIIRQRVNNVGTDLPEMLLVLYGVKDSICREINKQFNITQNPNGNSAYSWEAWDDSVPTPFTNIPIGADAFCHTQDSNTYGGYLHYVLYAR